MNLDLSVQRMAFTEARSLVEAQALIAKRREDVDLKEFYMHINSMAKDKPDASSEERAIRAVEATIVAPPAPPPPEPGKGVVVDKTA